MATSFSKWLALAGILSLGVSCLVAQESAALINILVKKGIVTDQEAKELQADLAKDTAASASADKLQLYTGLTELRISGDLRIRYEYRQGESVAGDNVERGRFRYRLRPTITGQLEDDWFFGFRLENGSGSRSSNGTFADSAGPWNKTNDGVYVGQVYLGYKASPDLTLYAGRMPNPFVNTLLVWDGDINPTGVAEQYKSTTGNTTYFANFGQFLYDSGNPQNSLAPTASHQDQYLLGWQGGATIKVNKTDSVQFAPTVYEYVNNKPGAKNFGGAFSPANTAAINNLLILDMPVDYTFTIPGGVVNRIFGDVAYNTDGKERAKKFGRTDLNNQVYAWQLGYQYGKAKHKGDWDAKAYYQYTGLFALDPNLVDSDIFDSRVNMKGVVFGVNYLITDAVTFSFTYANGAAGKNTAVTAGSGDLTLPTINKFNLLQFDVVAKF
jgi:hypothetical protein